MVLAIHFLHTQNIIHRDIKPANILLKNGHIKLADLGLAKALDKSMVRTRAGTPVYMSPEMIKFRPDGKLNVCTQYGCLVDWHCYL